MDYKSAAKNFLENEKQFQLGMIPTEQPNPITKGLSSVLLKDTKAGVKMILDADRDIPRAVNDAAKTQEFKNLVKDIKKAIDNRKTILLSSVGASGRMAVQIDNGWRAFWTAVTQKLPRLKEKNIEISNLTISMITGGDRAIVRSVENYEDYMSFGRQQVIDANVGKGDLVIGLAECGLSASINGSVLEADDRGCTTYYVYYNPKEILCKYLDRVRVVFERENIQKIYLFAGNMAIAGSTRMQAATVQLLAVGAALEIAGWQWLKENLSETELSILGDGAFTIEEYTAEYTRMLDQLSSEPAVSGIAKYIEYEAETYKKGGLITYATHDYQLDIMTDTTERQPTFTIPPFRRKSDKTSQVSWAFIKDPLYPTEVAWQHLLRREPKGLEWTVEDYKRLGASQAIINNPSQVGTEYVRDYEIGNEDDPSRYSQPNSKLVCVDIHGSACGKTMAWYNENVKKFSGGVVLRIGEIPNKKLADNEILIPVKVSHTITELMSHTMIKVLFNLISTASMTKLGRVWSNWMIQVLPTNKKLIYRSTRIIATIANIPYEQALEEFFKSYLGREEGQVYKESYVVESLRRLGFEPEVK